MKKLLANHPQKRAVAIYLGDGEVLVCRLALTILGTMIVESQTVPTNGQRLDPLIKSLIDPIRNDRKWRNAPIVVGISSLHVFFSTRPLKSLQCDATPQMLLHEMLRSSTLNIDDMEVDMIKRQLLKQPVASIVACQKRTLEPVMEALKERGVNPHQIEPGPCGLLREAIRRQKSPRRAQSVLRLILGASSALAILTADDFPLLWRSAEIEPGQEAQSIVSLQRCVEKLARYTGLETSPDAIMIHGRPDLVTLKDPALWGELASTVSRHDTPGFSAEEICLGLAQGGCSQSESFNLARATRPSVNLLRQVPWGQVVLQGGLMAAGGFFLGANLSDLDSTAAAIATERSGISWLKDQSLAKLQEEKIKLSDRLEVIRGFVGGKIIWSAGLREVSEGLPPEMTLSSFEGRCEYRPDSKGHESPKQSKRSMIATIEAPIPKGEAIPREIDGLIGKLRANPKIREDLPTIELGTLRWGMSGVSRVAMASFTVVCLPKTQTPPPKAQTGTH